MTLSIVTGITVSTKYFILLTHLQYVTSHIQDLRCLSSSTYIENSSQVRKWSAQKLITSCRLIPQTKSHLFLLHWSGRHLHILLSELCTKHIHLTGALARLDNSPPPPRFELHCSASLSVNPTSVNFYCPELEIESRVPPASRPIHIATHNTTTNQSQIPHVSTAPESRCGAGSAKPGDDQEPPETRA